MAWDYDPDPSPFGDSPRPSFGPPWLPISLLIAYLAYLAGMAIGR